MNSKEILHYCKQEYANMNFDCYLIKELPNFEMDIDYFTD